MYRIGIVLGLVVISTALVASAMTLSAALGLFAGGVDPMIPYSNTGKAQLEGAIAAFQTALKVPKDFNYTSESAYMALPIPLAQRDLVTKLSQCYFVLGDVFATTKANAMAAFVRGKLWGLKGLWMDPKFAATEKDHGFIAAVNQETDVAALYWTCANWGQVDQYDKLAAIEHDDPPKLLALIERVRVVDDTYMVYGAYRVLAGFWSGFPKLPFIKYHQDLPRVLSYICHVVDVHEYCSGCTDCKPAPQCQAYLENRRVFVEYYLIPKGLWTDAARVLDAIIAAPIGDKYPLYNAVAKYRAQELLVKVKRHL